MEHKVYVTYGSNSFVVNEPDPNDPWDNGNYDEDTFYIEVSCQPKRSDNYAIEVKVPFEPKVGMEVYVVWCHYGSGSTFGHTSHHFAAAGVFQNAKSADEIKEMIDQSVVHCLSNPYCYLDDYFGGLEGTFIVKDKIR